MTDQDMITAIISAIQDNSQLMTLIRFAITNNLPLQDTIHLTAIMNALSLPITD